MTLADQTRALIQACRAQGSKIETAAPLTPAQVEDLAKNKVRLGKLAPTPPPIPYTPIFTCNRVSRPPDQRRKPGLKSKYVLTSRAFRGLPSRSELRAKGLCDECGEKAKWLEAGTRGSRQKEAHWAQKCGACLEKVNAKARGKRGRGA